MTEKKKIFISHASPSDNYFSAWLASKLKLLGYDVWIELDELKSGDAFWPEIDKAIREQSIKFLTVVSDAYVQKANDAVSGVFKELSCADRIKDIKGFKTPLRIDAINPDNFPMQLIGLNAIDFFDNWQNGLEKLLESLEREKIPRNEDHAENPMNFWLEAFNVKKIVNSESEKIYTNWFPFELPQKLYIHKPSIENLLDLIDFPYSFIEYNDRHIAFFPATDYPEGVICDNSVELLVQDIISEQYVPIDDALVFNEPRKKIVELVNKTMSDFFIQSKMSRHKLSAVDVFYFPTAGLNKRISLKSIGKTNVAVTGKSKTNFWSFGISSYAILYPSPYLKISSHIIFENAQQIVLDPEEHHALRRKFAVDWYNKDWLDTMLGIMFRLSNNNENNQLQVSINKLESISVNAIPLSFDSYFGYIEPKSIEEDEE